MSTRPSAKREVQEERPKCELPELKTRPSTGPILAAISWPMLLEQYQRSNQPRVVPVLARYIGNQNYPCLRRSLAQQWHNTGLKVGITPANCVVCQKASVRPSSGTLLVTKSALLRQTVLYVIKTEFAPLMAHHSSASRHYSGKPCWKSKTQSLAQ